MLSSNSAQLASGSVWQSSSQLFISSVPDDDDDGYDDVGLNVLVCRADILRRGTEVGRFS